MLSVLDLANEDTQLHKASRNEQAGPCPDTSCRCQNDGFRVKWNGDRWVFMCRGCWDAEEYLAVKDRKRGWGDDIDYLRHYRKMSYKDAERLARSSDEEEQADQAPKPQRSPARLDYTSDVWQEATATAMQQHQARLWSDDTRALEYLHIRGLRNDIIQWAQLGYSLNGGIPRLLIPSMNDGRYVAIYRRDLRPDVPKEERWKDAPGGTKEELYLLDCLHRKLPTVLVESPLGALAILQEYGRESINVVATGGTNAGRSVKSLARLARMPLVLIAFDADKAGDEKAAWWKERLPHNGRRLRPYLKDVHEMLVEGWDIVGWISDALEQYQDIWLTAEPDRCSVCFGPAAGEPGPDGSMYCSEHHPGRQLSQLASEVKASPAALEKVLHRIQDADMFGPCEVEEFTGSIKDYIARRIQQLQEEAERQAEEDRQRARDVKTARREQAYAAIRRKGKGPDGSAA